MSSSTAASPRLGATKHHARIYVDVIIPVHNASNTIEEAVHSAMHQIIPRHVESTLFSTMLDVAVCCYNDGSTDNSWQLLCQLQQTSNEKQEKSDKRIQTRLIIANSPDCVARGAGYARNRAASLRSLPTDCNDLYFLCLLDSDDTMHKTRIAEQVCAMMALDNDVCNKTIMGCTFDRDPPNSTWHYAQWANGLSDERLLLERFREVTVLQPTWIMTKSRFEQLGGYVEAPHPKNVNDDWSVESCMKSNNDVLSVIHKTYDTPQSLRLAEDLRFFHSHLMANGLLRLHRTEQPLVTYRHVAGMSQSSQTPRKLLVQLRVLAFERAVLCNDPVWSGCFVVWGAGRDGKDFVKALSEPVRQRVACFVDVDEKKIDSGYYINRELDINIPIVHFSWLTKDRTEADGEVVFGRVEKGRNGKHGGSTEKQEPSGRKRQHQSETESPQQPKQKRSRSKVPKGLDLASFPKLPVVVCVALYRTGGALEANVKSVGRTEGKDLWHFS